MESVFREETSINNRMIPESTQMPKEEGKKLSAKQSPAARPTTHLTSEESAAVISANQKINQVSRRLVVDRLILENFKSYQGVQVIDKLDNSFVAVIGPNGSGKSNLLEALLFVFGYRAAKMRLKRLSELIHSSAGHQDIKRASVSVKFNEIEEIVEFDKPNSKLGTSEDRSAKAPPKIISSMTISRIVYASGESEYELDGVKKSRAELQDLFKQKGMDLSNSRFIILQGEVEQISLMKSTSGKKDEPGLLEYLEEIIGSGQYVDDINEMSEKHMIIRRQKEDTMVKLHDCKKELDSMETHKDQALEFLDLERRIMSLQHVNYSIKKYELKSVVQQHDTQLSEQEKVCQEKEQAHSEVQAELQVELDRKKKFLDQISKKETEKAQFQQEMEKYENSEMELRRNEKRLVDEESYLKGQIQAGEKEIQEKKSSIEVLQKEFPAMQSYFSQINIKLEGLSKQKLEIAKKIEPKVSKKRNLIETCNEELAKLESSIEYNDNTKRSLHQEISNLEDRKDRLEKDLIRGNSKIAESVARCDRSQTTLLSLKHERERIESTLGRITNEAEELERECGVLSHDLSVATNLLNERRHNTDDRHSKSKVLAYLHSHDSLRKRGKVYGRIGDLGSIDKQYDVAISATSTHFDCILVDSNDTAKNCLNELKRDRIGFAKFMALNQISKLRAQMETPFSPIAGTKRLFDLVNTKDPDVRLAFYKILKDTLVVEDLSAAQSIAFGNPDTAHKYRVVTKDGYIIDPNGSMTGGGKPKTGMVGNQIKPMLTDEEPTEKLAVRKDNLLERLESQNRILAIKKRDLHTLPVALANIQNHIHRAEEELRSEIDSKTEWSDKLKRIQGELGALDFETKQSDKRKKIKELEVENQNILKTMEEFKKTKQEMEIKVGEIGGEEFRKLEKEMNQLRELAAKEQSKLDKAEASRQTYLKFISERQTLLDRLHEDLNSLAADREKKSTAVKEVGELFRVWTEKVDGLEHEIEELEDQKPEFDELIQQKEAKVQIANSELQTAKQAYAETSDVITQLNDELEDVEQEIKVNTEMYTNFKEAYLSVQELFKVKETAAQPADSDQNSKIVEEAAEEGSGRKKKGKGGKTDKTKAKKSGAEGNLSLDLVTPDSVIEPAHIESWGLTQIKVENLIASLKLKKKSHIANTDIIHAYREKMVEYQTKFKEFQTSSESESTLRGELEELKSKRRNEFTAGFNFIAKTLKTVYETLTGGGDAELEYVDSHDPFSEGISFSVRPPHKSWKQMSKLSGGEKTLSSLSLIFALHYYKPTPIYIMDEIDAALDFRNVEIVSKFIKERTRDAQFIVISLRNYMYEQANQLLGVCKINDTTKTVRVEPQRIEGMVGGLPDGRSGKKENKLVEEEKDKKDSAEIEQIKKNMLKSRSGKSGGVKPEYLGSAASTREDVVEVSEDVSEGRRHDKSKSKKSSTADHGRGRDRDPVAKTHTASNMR